MSLIFRFNGEWKESKMNGKGTFTWNDGKKYIGKIQNLIYLLFN